MIQQKCSMYLRILFVVHFCRVFPFSQFFLLEEHIVYKYDTFSNMLLYINYLGKICYINQYQSMYYFFSIRLSAHVDIGSLKKI